MYWFKFVITSVTRSYNSGERAFFLSCILYSADHLDAEVIVAFGNQARHLCQRLRNLGYVSGSLQLNGDCQIGIILVPAIPFSLLYNLFLLPYFVETILLKTRICISALFQQCNTFEIENGRQICRIFQKSFQIFIEITVGRSFQIAAYLSHAHNGK